MSGTSASCPLVAGLAALIKSKNNNLDPNIIRDTILYSSDRLNPTFDLRRGRINTRNALKRGNGNGSSIIEAPSHGAEVKGIVKINGAALGEGFQNYKIES